MITTTITATLEEIVQPLVDVLNAKYSFPNCPYEVAASGQIGARGIDPHELAVRVPGDTFDHEPAMSALFTVFLEAPQLSARVATEDNADPKALRFGFLKRYAWVGRDWDSTLYLVIQHTGNELDADAATRQIAKLVGLLEDDLLEIGTFEESVFHQ